jgi:hypothetical protein
MKPQRISTSIFFEPRRHKATKLHKDFVFLCAFVSLWFKNSGDKNDFTQINRGDAKALRAKRIKCKTLRFPTSVVKKNPLLSTAD